MEIKGLGRPRIFQYGVLMSSETQLKQGVRLKPEFIKAERPEITRRILVVDDEAGILKAIKRFLGKLEAEIVLVDPLQPIKEQVLSMAEREAYDLIIMDGLMPGIAGADLTGELRNRGFQGYIVANSSMPEEQTRMLRAGADFSNPDKNITKLLGFFAI